MYIALHAAKESKASFRGHFLALLSEAAEKLRLSKFPLSLSLDESVFVQKENAVTDAFLGCIKSFTSGLQSVGLQEKL